MEVIKLYVLAYIHYDLEVFCGLQNCTDVLEAVPDLCSETCVAPSDIKIEEDSDMSEEEDPLAVTSPAVKAEQEVSNVCLTCVC